MKFEKHKVKEVSPYQKKKAKPTKTKNTTKTITYKIRYSQIHMRVHYKLLIQTSY